MTEVPWNDDTSTRFVNEWVELQHPDPSLMTRDKDSLLLAKRFEILSDGICDACVLAFWERARAEGAQSKEWMRGNCANATAA